MMSVLFEKKNNAIYLIHLLRHDLRNREIIGLLRRVGITASKFLTHERGIDRKKKLCIEADGSNKEAESQRLGYTCAGTSHILAPQGGIEHLPALVPSLMRRRKRKTINDTPQLFLSWSGVEIPYS